MKGSSTPRIVVTLALLVSSMLLALVGLGWLDRSDDTTPRIVIGSSTQELPGNAEALLYGRVTTDDGTVYEGRLRWGGDQETSWSDTFHGTKGENPWVELVPAESLPTKERSVEILGFEIDRRADPVDLDRPFLARFGDLVRIERLRRTIRVTLKSGTVVELDRFSAGDFDDGVRVWDPNHGVVDLGPRQIRTIELLSSPSTAPAPARLFGTVRTRQGSFTGQVRWNRDDSLGSDTLEGTGEVGELGTRWVSLRFDTLRSIARASDDSARVTLLDGREIVLSDSPEVGEANRGIAVDDPRFGRVTISWGTFERLDFELEDGRDDGPTYDDFPPGRPLAGRVLTRAGRSLAGRLVFDLDESETTDTLDAPFLGVDYTLIFERIARIELRRGDGEDSRQDSVTLRGGERLRLEAAGDLGEGNGGLLVFVEGRSRPEYVPWVDVERVDLDPPRLSPSETPPPTVPRSGLSP